MLYFTFTHFFFQLKFKSRYPVDYGFSFQSSEIMFFETRYLRPQSNTSAIDDALDEKNHGIVGL